MIYETLDDEDVIEILPLVPAPLEPTIIVDLDFDEITLVRPPDQNLLRRIE